MFESWTEIIKNKTLQKKMIEIFAMIEQDFPGLKAQIKWNQPMLIDHGTYIIGFSASKNHLSAAPGQQAMKEFANEIEQAGYSSTPNLFRILPDSKTDLDLIRKIIAFNIENKKDATRFWG